MSEDADIENYVLSLLLAALAGVVDAIGFVHWHSLFVSFMSGNSTILGAASAEGDWHGAAVSLAVIGGFVVGVAFGELLHGVSGFHAQSVVLLAEAVLLTCGACAVYAGQVQLLAAPLLSGAMGVQNGCVHRAANINVALTYVTGTLVHLGRRLAKAVRGDVAWSAALPFFGLWCGLVTGATIGARLALTSETIALVGAACTASLLALIVFASTIVRSRSMTTS